MNSSFPVSRSRRASSGPVLFLVLLGLGFLSACATSMIKLYPDFNKQKQRISSIAVLCDYSVVDDVKGKTDLADVPRNLEAAKSAMDALEAQLAAKGYKVVGKDVASMGLFIKGGKETYKLAAEKSPVDDAELAALPVVAPPFYLNRALFDADDKVTALNAVMDKLGHYSHKAGQPLTTIPEATKVRTGHGEDVVLYLVMVGRDVPLGKSILEGVGTSILSLGMLTAYHTSVAMVDVFLVDSKTGEVLWADGASGQDMRPSSPKTHSRLFKTITNSMPVR